MCYFCTITNILWLQIIEIKYISHIKKTAFLTTQPQSRSYRAVSKCHTAGRLMGDLQTLANIGKHRGMFTNDVTCTHGGKTNGAVHTFTGVAFTTVDRAIFQIFIKGVGDRLSIASAVPDGASTLCL